MFASDSEHIIRHYAGRGMKRNLISMKCRYIMGHPEIKEKIPVKLYREGADILILDRERTERGRVPLGKIMNMAMESKGDLQAYLAQARLGTLRNSGFLGGEGMNPKDRMLLIDWRLPNNTIITTVFEYSGFLSQFKADVANGEIRKIMRQISSEARR